jgi:hypothetical protein
MVIRLLTAALLLAAFAACTSQEECTKGSEFEPPLCPLNLPAIKTLTITENASKAPAETDPAVSCDSFKVDEQAVRRYFEGAKSTNANDAHHTLDYSPCYASGEVTFADGRSGRWTVSQLRSGSLIIGNAEPVILYCPTCEFAPFQ